MAAQDHFHGTDGPRGLAQQSGATGPTGPTAASRRNFQSIDLDVWAQQFLAALDLYLSPQYALPIFQLIPSQGNTGATGGAAIFEQLVEAKKLLAERIATGVDYVLAGPQSAHDLALAREAMRQRLLINLAQTYATSAIIQTPFAVTLGATGPTGPTGAAPRLAGNPINRAASPTQGATGPTGAASTYSLSSAKVPLIAPTTAASMLFDVKAAADHKDFPLDLDFVINELEYDIQDATDIKGYQSSQWMSFIVPIESSTVQPDVHVDTRIGPLDVPIPLRAYPTPPSLIAQSGQPSIPQPTSLADAKLWDYSFTYEHQSAAQDTIFIVVTFNEQQVSHATALTDEPDLFANLAQFTVVYPELEHDLALLPTLTPNSDASAALKAISTFADLASQVAKSWRFYPPENVATRRAQGANSLPNQVYQYRLTLERSTSAEYLASLTLTLLPQSIGDEGRWPVIFVNDLPDPLTILVDPERPNEARYTYPANTVRANVPIRHTFTFKQRNIIQVANARAGVYVTRNQYLVSGPTGATGPATNPAFVYQTPLVQFSNKLTPVLIVSQAINIVQDGAGAESVAASSLAEHLSRMFTSLLEIKADDKQPSHLIGIAARYGYTLIAGTDKQTLTTFVPILLRPTFLFTPRDIGVNDPTTFVAQLAEFIEHWQSTATPAQQNGLYIFDVSLLSQDSTITTTGPLGTPGPTALHQPLLELQNLQLFLRDVGSAASEPVGPIGPTGEW